VANGGGDSGGGTVPKGYIPIASVADFKKIGKDQDYPLDGKYYQTQDITISNSDSWAPIGTIEYDNDGQYVYDNTFQGTFDGNDHNIIANSLTSSSEFSFFGATTGATLKNIHISGSITITGNVTLGGIATQAFGTTFINCSNAATLIVPRQAGGIVYYATGIMNADGAVTKETIITGCSNTGNITGSRGVGGIVGMAYEGTKISSCFNSGSISAADGASYVYLGGIVGGTTSDSTITACYNAGSISVPVLNDSNSGGIVGRNKSDITACYNKGAISVDNSDMVTIYIGGIFGESSATASITACYSSGNFTGSGSSIYTGSIGGYSLSNTGVTACWYSQNSISGIGGVSTNDQITASDQGTTKFDASWPATNSDTEWGIGDGSGSGKYWKSLGSSPLTYPKLWFES
jgi:hypothetical protein